MAEEEEEDPAGELAGGFADEPRRLRAGDYIEASRYDDFDADQGQAAYRILALPAPNEHGQFTRA
eukprot:6240843-Pyramimonas_sp.AAC.1